MLCPCIEDGSRRWFARLSILAAGPCLRFLKERDQPTRTCVIDIDSDSEIWPRLKDLILTRIMPVFICLSFARHHGLFERESPNTDAHPTKFGHIPITCRDLNDRLSKRIRVRRLCLSCQLLAPLLSTQTRSPRNQSQSAKSLATLSFDGRQLHHASRQLTPETAPRDSENRIRI
jgi:hypothetical protein